MSGPTSTRGGRIDSVALEIDVAAEAVAVFVEAVQPQADALASGWSRSAVRRRRPSRRPKRCRSRDVLKRRLLEHAVDDSAAAAAAEDHRVGSFQHLDAVDIVEIAEILDVVAHAIDEEVGRARIAAQHERVAIAFARIVGCARNESSRSPTERSCWSPIWALEMMVIACGMLLMSVGVLVAGWS